MATETGENRYKKYGQPTLDLQFSGPKGSIRNRADGGSIGVEFTRTQDTQASYIKSDGTIGYASTDVPRFDHDPTTGENLGLLMEESRTNNIISSNFQFYEYPYDYWLLGSSQISLLNNRGIAPDGTFTASLYEQIDVCTNNQSRVGANPSSNGNFDSNSQYYFSYFVKLHTPSTVNKVGFSFATQNFSYTSATTPEYLSARFEFSNDGEITFVQTGYSDPNSLYEKHANGWYRISIPIYTGSVQTDLTGVRISVGEESGLSPSTYGKFLIWGACIEKGNFRTSYIPSLPSFTSRASEATFYNENGIVSTASTDVARDDAYLPDENGVFYPVGLLLEEERDNILLHSKDFSSTWDGSTNGTLTLNATTSPDGTNNAALFQNDGLDNTFLGRGLFQTFTGIGATTPMVGSVYVKNNDASLFTFGLGSLNNRSASLQFDFSTETVTSLSDGGRGSTMSSKVDKLPNDWYRLSFSLTTVDISVNRIVLNADTGNDITSVYVWGAQLEVNNDEVGNLNFIEQSTSYIPTTSGISTRAADISSSSTSTRGIDLAQITGSNFSSLFPSVGSGSVFVEGDVIGEKLNTSVGSFASFGTNVNDNFLYFLAYDNRNNVGFIQPSGGNVSKYHDLTGKTFKGATAWTDLADTPSTGSSALDGDLYGGSHWGYAGVQNPANYDRFGIGRVIRSSTTFGSINGHVKRLTYWPTRLSDSDLQRLTE